AIIQPTFFREGKALKDADIYDFIEMLITKGEASKESSELIELLPKLREKHEAYKANMPKDTPPTTPTNTPKGDTPEPIPAPKDAPNVEPEPKGEAPENELLGKSEKLEQPLQEAPAPKESPTQAISELRQEAKTNLNELVGKDIVNKDGTTAQVSHKNIAKMLSDKAIQKSVNNGFTQEQHFKAVSDIKNLFERAEFKETTSDLKNNDKAIRIHRYNADFDNANALITLKESLDKNKKRIYTLELESLESRLSTKPHEKNNSALDSGFKDFDTSAGSNMSLKDSNSTTNPPKNTNPSNENSLELKELESKLSQINEEIEKSALEQKAQGGYMSETTKQILRATKASKILKPFEKAYFGKEYPKELERILADFGFESNKALSDNAIQLKNNTKAVIEDYKTSYKNQLQNEVQNTTAKKAKENLHFRLSQILPREQVQNLDNLINTKLLSDIKSGKDLALYETIANEQIKRLREHIESTLNITPIKDFGTNYAEFYHDGKGAVKKLLQEKQGQVVGAYERKDLGDIDLVWGEYNKETQKGFGLSKILAKHPEITAEILTDIINNGVIKRQENEAIQILRDNYKVVLKSNWKGEPTKNKWIVTSYETKGEKGSSISSEPLTKGDNLPLNSSADSTTNKNLIQDNPPRNSNENNFNPLISQINAHLGSGLFGGSMQQDALKTSIIV
ncbi:hypothetical protein CQA49_09715, partial [Helicobacter sp. MIT 00-7814]